MEGIVGGAREDSVAVPVEGSEVGAWKDPVAVVVESSVAGTEYDLEYLE